MDLELQAVAQLWLAVAEQLGWGVEGPAGHAEVTAFVRHLAVGDPPPLPVVAGGEGASPGAALREAAAQLGRAAAADGEVRSEHLSAARGWLEIARR